MNESVKFKVDWDISRIIIVAILGICSGAILVTSAAYGKKWLVAVSLGLISLFSLFAITRNLKYFFTLLAVFFIPIRLDFHLIFKTTPYVQLKGLPLTMFDIAFALLIVYWIFQLLSREKDYCFFPSISIPALLYILLAGISAFSSQDRELSFSMLFLIMKAYLVFLYFANNIRTKEEILGIIAVLTFGIFIQSSIGIMQHISGGTLGMDIFGEGERAFRTTVSGYTFLTRVGGTLGDPNSLAMYLNFILPILLCFLFTKTHLKLRLFAGTVFFSGVLAEIFTLSRGGWIALSSGLIIALYGIYKGKLKSRLKSIAIILIIISFFTVTILGFFPDVRARLFEDDYGAAYSRVPMIKVAYNVIKDNPLRGVGLNNYTTVMNRYDRTRENISYNFPFPVHNAFLIIASESGLLALFCFLLVILGNFRKSMLFFKGKYCFLSILGIGCICGILTWIIHAQFKMDFAGINVVLWFSMGMVAALHRMLQVSLRDELNKPSKESWS